MKPNKPFTASVEATTRDGFPVIVKGRVCPPEPDVGLDTQYLDWMEVQTIKGKPADFLKLSERELRELEAKFWDGIE